MIKKVIHNNRTYFVNDQTGEVKDASSDALDFIGDIFTGGLLNGDKEPSKPSYQELKNKLSSNK
jgi:hypothetical protein